MQAFWKRSIKLPGIDTGPANSSKRMLVYFDPNCPVCARQWKVLQPYLDQVRIHWIPVAYIDTTSAPKAAAILAAKDPGQALSNNERDYDFKTQQGGLTPSDMAPDWALRKVKANTREMMRAGGLAATPTLVFELYPGKRYFRMEGLVDAASMKVAVAELGHTMDPWKHPKSVSDGNDGR
jgi:protein-disulfide isomerase